MIDHLALGGQLIVTNVTSFGVDTAQFFGTGQAVPVGNINYSVIVVSGDSVDVSPGEYLGSINTAELIVRGPGARAWLYSTDEGGPGTLVMRDVNAGVTATRIVRSSDPMLADIRLSGDGIVLGAGATMAAIATHRDLAFLAQVARSVGGPQIRNMATVGGNLLQASRCWYFRHPDLRWRPMAGAEMPCPDGPPVSGGSPEQGMFTVGHEA